MTYGTPHWATDLQQLECIGHGSKGLLGLEHVVWHLQTQQLIFAGQGHVCETLESD
jgi:hypothetical protein